jgi:transcriptional regulator with XRE-family HTH domain
MPKRKPEQTAADVLTDVGLTLFDGAEDWQSELAKALDVRRDTIRDWRSGRMVFGPDHGALDKLFELLTRREGELRHAKRLMKAWMQRHKPQEP